MGITPSQLLGLDYVWRGAPRVRLASPSLDTLALDLTWRGAPLVADALEPEPLSLWAEPLLELDGAAESQVVESLWGAGVVSLFGSTATLATAAEVQAGGVLRVEGEALPSLHSTLASEAALAGIHGAVWAVVGDLLAASAELGIPSGEVVASELAFVDASGRVFLTGNLDSTTSVTLLADSSLQVFAEGRFIYLRPPVLVRATIARDVVLEAILSAGVELKAGLAREVRVAMEAPAQEHGIRAQVHVARVVEVRLAL